MVVTQSMVFRIILLIFVIFCLWFFPLDYLIGEVYVERILVKLNETLSKVKNLSEAENNDSSVSFICDVAYDCFSSATGCLLLPSAEDLLLTLFQLCAQSKEKTHLPGNSSLLSVLLESPALPLIVQVSSFINWVIMCLKVEIILSNGLQTLNTFSVKNQVKDVCTHCVWQEGDRLEEAVVDKLDS